MINTKYLLVILILSSTIFAQQSNIGYEWKLKPGMLEWKELTTHKQMLEVLQIPKESLKNMTTVELVYTCLNYPLFPDIWAYNSLQKGMEYVISDFNGLQEILKREDSGATLFTIYKKMDPNNYNRS